MEIGTLDVIVCVIVPLFKFVSEFLRTGAALSNHLIKPDLQALQVIGLSLVCIN